MTLYYKRTFKGGVPGVVWKVIISIVVVLAAVLIGFVLGFTYRKKVSEREISSAEEEAKRIINEGIKTAENKKREALLEAKEEAHRVRSECDREVKERRKEVQRQEEGEHPVQLLQKLPRLGEAEHVVCHRFVQPGQDRLIWRNLRQFIELQPAHHPDSYPGDTAWPIFGMLFLFRPVWLF